MENSFIIENLLQQSESIRLEFKAKADVNAIARSITAFINTQGGDLIVGVNDEKKVIGVENAEEIAADIQKHLVDHIKPTAPIVAQVVPYKKKQVILVSVWEGAKKPYQYNGLIFNRAGKTTQTTKSDRLPELIKQRKQSDFHWERMPVLGAELSDLDSAEIKHTVKLYREYKSNVSVTDNEDFLIQTGLIQNGNITNACIVLFGKSPSRFIPQSKIRITLYPGKTSGNQFLDDKIFDGNIFKNIASIFEYLDLMYGKTSTVGGLLRTDRSNYPNLAIREGILNAIVHRDYNSVRGFLQISIFSDRTEISSYGALPDGITVADLKIEHVSILRNPDIAQICFYRKYIEMLGSGTLRMINDCKINKFKAPVWTVNEHTTTVVFMGVTHGKNTAQEQKTAVQERLSKAMVAKADHIIQELTGDITDVVKQRLINMIFYIDRHKGIKVVDLTEHFKVSERTIKENLRLLIDLGLIEYSGSKKAGSYSLTKRLHDKLH